MAISESSPLLGDDRSEASHPDSRRNSQTPLSNQSHGKFNNISLLLGMAVLIFVIDFASYLTLSAQTAIMEQLICDDYYGKLIVGHDPGTNSAQGDTRCKIEPVQSELALVNGWTETFINIPGMILALPFGALSDRIGRKPVFLLALLGILLTQTATYTICWFHTLFPLRAIWAAAFLQLIGGGGPTAITIVLVIIADVTPPEQRGMILSEAIAVIMVSQLLSMTLSAYLTSINPWIPLTIALCGYVLSILIGLFLPETLPPHTRKAVPLVPDVSKSPSGNGVGALRIKIQEISHELGKALIVIKQNYNVLLMMFGFLVSNIGKSMSTLILQYASKKLGWTIAKAGYLLSLQAGVHIVILLFLLPVVSAFISTRLNVQPIPRDKILTEVSGLFLLTGALVQFFASAPESVIFGLVVSACGCGYDVTARSLVALVIQPEALGTVYAAITVMSSVGVVIAGPMMAATFRWGMRLGDGNFWLGMPFLVAAALYALAVLAVGVTRVDEETIRRLSREDGASLIGGADGDHDDEGQYVGHQV